MGLVTITPPVELGKSEHEITNCEMRKRSQSNKFLFIISLIFTDMILLQINFMYCNFRC